MLKSRFPLLTSSGSELAKRRLPTPVVAHSQEFPTGSRILAIQNTLAHGSPACVVSESKADAVKIYQPSEPSIDPRSSPTNSSKDIAMAVLVR